MKTRIFSGAPSEDFAGYAKAVIDGDRIYVSGTLGPDPDSKAFPDDAGAQTRHALDSIAEALAQAGASLSDVVQCRVFITDPAWLRPVAAVLGEIFRDIRPTNTMLVCQIPFAGAKVEIEVTASRIAG